MIICRGTNVTDGQLFTSLFRDKLSLQGARTDPTGSNKRAGEDNLEEEKGKRQKRSGAKKK